MTSCSTYRKSILGGILRSPDAIIFKSVDLPRPFGPTNPYRRPWEMPKAASLKRIFPAALMLKFGTVISRAFSHCGSFSFTAVCEQANWAPSFEALAAATSYSASRISFSRSLASRFRSLLLSFFPSSPCVS